MSIKMDDRRIEELKCSFCGDKRKKRVNLESSDSTIAYGLVCCSCGHVDVFCTSYEAIPVCVAGVTVDGLKNLVVRCGSPKCVSNDCTGCVCKPTSN